MYDGHWRTLRPSSSKGSRNVREEFRSLLTDTRKFTRVKARLHSDGEQPDPRRTVRKTRCRQQKSVVMDPEIESGGINENQKIGLGPYRAVLCRRYPGLDWPPAVKSVLCN